MAAGADVIFTMLNSGRDGVTQACREAGARQIGNVIDWTTVDPQVFVASAWGDGHWRVLGRQGHTGARVRPARVFARLA